MNSLHYRLIAIGAICVAINVQINGLGILLPTCIGYALIGVGAWGLRDEDVIFRYAPIPAVFLSVLSFPDLFRGAMFAPQGQPHPLHTFDQWNFYPFTILHMVFLAVIAIAIARQAKKWDERSVYIVAVAAVVAVILFELPRFLMPFPSRPYYIAFFVVTTAYMVLLVWASLSAATRLP